MFKLHATVQTPCRVNLLKNGVLFTLFITALILTS